MKVGNFRDSVGNAENASLTRVYTSRSVATERTHAVIRSGFKDPFAAGVASREYSRLNNYRDISAAGLSFSPFVGDLVLLKFHQTFGGELWSFEAPRSPRT